MNGYSSNDEEHVLVWIRSPEKPHARAPRGLGKDVLTVVQEWMQFRSIYLGPNERFGVGLALRKPPWNRCISINREREEFELKNLLGIRSDEYTDETLTYDSG